MSRKKMDAKQIACMKRMPKIYSYALWVLVFARLLGPFSLEAGHAVMPDADRVNRFMEQLSGGENMEQSLSGQQVRQYWVLANKGV